MALHELVQVLSIGRHAYFSKLGKGCAARTHIGIRRGSPLKSGKTRTWRAPHGLSAEGPATRLGGEIEFAETRVAEEAAELRLCA